MNSELRIPRKIESQTSRLSTYKSKIWTFLTCPKSPHFESNSEKFCQTFCQLGASNLPNLGVSSKKTELWTKKCFGFIPSLRPSIFKNVSVFFLYKVKYLYFSWADAHVLIPEMEFKIVFSAKCTLSRLKINLVDFNLISLCKSFANGIWLWVCISQHHI